MTEEMLDQTFSYLQRGIVLAALAYFINRIRAFSNQLQKNTVKLEKISVTIKPWSKTIDEMKDFLFGVRVKNEARKNNLLKNTNGHKLQEIIKEQKEKEGQG